MYSAQPGYFLASQLCPSPPKSASVKPSRSNFYSTTPAANVVILITAPRWLAFVPSQARNAGRSYDALARRFSRSRGGLLAWKRIAVVSALVTQELQQPFLNELLPRRCTQSFPLNPEGSQPAFREPGCFCFPGQKNMQPPITAALLRA